MEPSVEPLPSDDDFGSEPLPSDDDFGSEPLPESSVVQGGSLIGEGFTPFQLSYLAIAGGLDEEGIPGGDRLVSAYDGGELSASDIVEAGDISNRLGEAASDREDFTKDVERFLTLFSRDARNN